jgi:hypothetical protein
LLDRTFLHSAVPVQEVFLKKYSGNQKAEELVAYQRHEAHLYDRYKAYYGYVFLFGKDLSQGKKM